MLTVKSPARINVLGEHLDYNHGIVLPVAIDKNIIFCISKRDDNKVLIYAHDLEQQCQLDDINKPELSDLSWANHLVGILLEISKKFDCGINVCFGGNIPLGGGLSSSAAVEIGFAYGLNQLFNLGLTSLDLCLIAQKTEHNAIGVKCGIMDMYAIVFSKGNNLLALDCLTNTHEYVPIDAQNYQFSLFNTGIKHSLATSAYNDRRQECEVGLEELKLNFVDINSFRDVKVTHLNTIKLTENVLKRCQYVVEEIVRVGEMIKYLKVNNLIKIGALLNATHEGLKTKYEVSCVETDFLVDELNASGNVYGARMMGGGFGGCVLALNKTKLTDDIKSNISDKYYKKFGINLQIYDVNLAGGVEMVD